MIRAAWGSAKGAETDDGGSGTELGRPEGNPEGRPVVNSRARWEIRAVRSFSECGSTVEFSFVAEVASSILVIMIDGHIVQARDGIVGQDGDGEIAGDEVGSDGVFVRAHVSDRESGFDFAGDTNFLQSDHTLLGFADAKEKNGSVPIFIDRQLVAGDEGNSTPSDER